MQIAPETVAAEPKPRRTRTRKQKSESAPVEAVETEAAEPVETAPETLETSAEAETAPAEAAGAVQESTETAQGEADDTQKVESVHPVTSDAVQAFPDVQAETPKPAADSFELAAALTELRERREWERKIEAINDDVQELESDFKEKKEAASAAKKRWEAKQSYLSEVIAKGREKLPLFDQPRDEPAPVETPAAVAKPSAEPWRVCRLDALEGLTPGILAALAEAGIETIGAITDHTSRGKRLTDIKGLGEASLEKIDDALAGFWKTQTAQPAEASVSSEPAAAEPTAKPKRTRKRKPKAEAVEVAAESDPNLDAVAEAAEAGHFDAAEQLAIDAIGSDTPAESDFENEPADDQDADDVEAEADDSDPEPEFATSESDGPEADDDDSDDLGPDYDE